MNKTLTYIVIVVLVLLLVYQTFFRKFPTETIIEHSTDTTYVCKTDTITRIKTEYISERAVDTLVIQDTIYLPVTQRYYSEKGAYDLWISGVNPKLDSIKTYKEYVYKTITNTEKEKVYLERWHMYADINAIVIGNGNVIPMVGLTFNTPKKFTFGAKIGIYDHKVAYGFNIGIRIF